MNRLSIVILATVTSLAIVASSADAQSFKRIRKEADFRAKVVGKTLLAEASGMKLVIADDGKISGTASQGKIVGAWNWQGSYWCRNINVGTLKLGSDCQKIEIAGTLVQFTREKGKGKVTLVAIQ